MPKQVLMGGSPSTGSSLLVNILNRHAHVSAGPETYLFIHPRLFTAWDRYRRYLLRTSKFGGLKSEGWFLMNGAQLLNPDYHWSASDLADLIEHAPDLTAFAQSYMAKRISLTGARLWVEKSPANAINFHAFLQAFPSPGVIHTLRDPYDTAASLYARGLTPYQAAGAYIVHTALALRVWDHPGAFQIRYEDLTTAPRETIRRLLDFLQCPWEEKILEPTPAEKRQEVRMEGWLQNEKAGIGTASIGRFLRLPPPEQKKLVNALALFRISPGFARRYGIAHTSLATIAPQLHYPYREPERPNTTELRRQMLQDRWHRFRRLYPARGEQYPGGLSC